MIDRLRQQREREDAEAQRRSELYPDEAEHAGSGAVTFWRCGCGEVGATAAGEKLGRCVRCGAISPVKLLRPLITPVL